MTRNRFALVTLLFACLFALSCGENPASATSGPQGAAAPDPNAKGPRITLDIYRVPQGGYVYMKGSGFSPVAEVISHLKKPDGTEYPELIFVTDEKGEFSHHIESFLLLVGVHEVWVFDRKTGLKSNVEKFETTLDQIPLAK
jgi:hypothetical protein